MQQNQSLQKVSLSEAYYKRQLWVFNLTVMVDRVREEKEIPNKDDVGIYTWTKNLTDRGSNEVASAVMHFLKTYIIHKYKNRPILRLFSDSYPAQNKNRSFLCILLCFVNQQTVFEKIKYYFPVRGHSYLPPDHVFG